MNDYMNFTFRIFPITSSVIKRKVMFFFLARMNIHHVYRLTIENCCFVRVTLLLLKLERRSSKWDDKVYNNQHQYQNQLNNKSFHCDGLKFQRNFFFFWLMVFFIRFDRFALHHVNENHNMNVIVKRVVLLTHFIHLFLFSFLSIFIDQKSYRLTW